MIKTSYQNLLVWQRSIELVKCIYTITKQFPKEELYSLTDQIKRASMSISANIAEGSQRTGNKEFLYFLHISKGSAAELETFLIISKELGFTTEENLIYAKSLVLEILKMLSALIKSLSKD